MKTKFKDYVSSRITGETELINKSKILSDKDKQMMIKNVSEKYGTHEKKANEIFGRISKIQSNASKDGRKLTKPEIDKISSYYKELESLVQGLDLTPKTEGEKLIEQSRGGVKLSTDEQSKAIESLTKTATEEAQVLAEKYKIIAGDDGILNSKQTKEFESAQNELFTKYRDDLSMITGEVKSDYDVLSGLGTPDTNSELLTKDFQERVGGVFSVLKTTEEESGKSGKKSGENFNSSYNSTVGNNKPPKQQAPEPPTKQDVTNKLNKTFDSPEYRNYLSIKSKKVKPANLTAQGRMGGSSFTKAMGNTDVQGVLQKTVNKSKNVKTPDLSSKGSKTTKTINNGITGVDVKGKLQKQINKTEKAETPDLSGIGSGIMEGIASGLASYDLKSILDATLSKIPNWAKKLLGINSPAKVMIPIGKGIIEGTSLGMTLEQANMQKTLGSVFNTASDIPKSALNSASNKVSNNFVKTIKNGWTNAERSLKNLKLTVKAGVVVEVGVSYGARTMQSIKNKNDRAISKNMYDQTMKNPAISDEDKERITKEYQQWVDDDEREQSRLQELANAETKRDTDLANSRKKYYSDLNKWKKAQGGKKSKKNPKGYTDKELENKKSSLEKAQTKRDNKINLNYELDVSNIDMSYDELEKYNSLLKEMGYTTDFDSKSKSIKITGKSDTNIDNSTNYYTVNANNVDEQKVIDLLYKQKRGSGAY